MRNLLVLSAITRLSLLFFALTVNLTQLSAAKAEEVEKIRVMAAGSLHAAMEELVRSFAAVDKTPIDLTFGPAGRLRQAIENGSSADIFASADLGNPDRLFRLGKAGPVINFAQTQLCAFLRPGLPKSSGRLLSLMLDPKLKLGIAAPQADPAGDYAFAMFDKAEALRPGSGKALKAKAIPLLGIPNFTPPPPGTDLIGWFLKTGRADLFLAYCSGSAAFSRRFPEGGVGILPAELAVTARFGLTVLTPQNADADRFAFFLLSREGQAILAKNGFQPTLLATEQQ